MLLWCVLFLLLPVVFKVYPNIVTSGSMEPEIATGSLVYVDAGYPVEKIKENDVIQFELMDGTDILHRVIEVESEDSCFQTKGDANDTADLGRIHFEQYRGKFLAAIPYIGYGIKFFGNKYSMIGIVIIYALVLVRGMIKRKRKNKT